MGFRNLIRSALPVLLGVLAIAGCSKSEPEETVTQPVLKLRTNPAPKEAGSQMMVLSAEGSWTLALEYEGAQSGWASLGMQSGSGSNGGILFSYTENADEEARSLNIVASNRLYSTRLHFTQEGRKKASPGGGGSSKAAAKWLELPETSDEDGFDFYSHEMTYHNAVVRNYSFYWDYDNLVAPWVAYPLVAGHLGNSGRSDAWDLNPLMARNLQPVLFKGFSEGTATWKARGHQLPSADRTFSYAANASTFYGTNMTPQINDKFNSGIWASLEGMVRDWARKSDTLYVVTGCSTKGSTTYVLDNDGKHVTVPTGYFKAILRYNSNSTGNTKYSAIAFWFDHKEYSSSYAGKGYCLSVDRLEERLGYDLFVNLPDAIGKDEAAAVEAQDPTTVSWWW